MFLDAFLFAIVGTGGIILPQNVTHLPLVVLE